MKQGSYEIATSAHMKQVYLVVKRRAGSLSSRDQGRRHFIEKPIRTVAEDRRRRRRTRKTTSA